MESQAACSYKSYFEERFEIMGIKITTESVF